MDTVHVVIATAGGGVARVPSEAVRAAVDAHVNSQRPVTVEGYTTLVPRTIAPGMAIQIRVVPSAKYAFALSSANASYSVVAYSPPSSTAATLTLSPAPPADLVAAIGKAAASLSPAFPQLLVLASGPGATVLPLVLSCTAVADSVLTVSGGPLAGVINVGDPVFAGGPVVGPIANAVLAYGDSLGPSRQSELVDPNDYWEDTCAIARLIQLALDIEEAKGVPLCRNLVTDGTTIDGKAKDRQATDATGGAPRAADHSLHRHHGLTHVAIHQEVRELPLSLWPPGRLYDWYTPTSKVSRYLDALAETLKTFAYDVVDRLRREVYPAAAVEKLPDWEESLGLADSYTSRYGTVAQRQAAVLGKLREFGAFTLPNVRATLAPLLGYADLSQLALLEASRTAMRDVHTYTNAEPVQGRYTISSSVYVSDGGTVSSAGAQVTVQLPANASTLTLLRAPSGQVAKWYTPDLGPSASTYRRPRERAARISTTTAHESSAWVAQAATYETYRRLRSRSSS